MRLWERENNRNTDNEALFREMISVAYPDTTLVVAGHHIFVQRGGSTEEIPSADHLIFDHTIAKAVWGASYKDALTQLALEPVETRDVLLQHLFQLRGH